MAETPKFLLDWLEENKQRRNFINAPTNLVEDLERNPRAYAAAQNIKHPELYDLSRFGAGPGASPAKNVARFLFQFNLENLEKYATERKVGVWDTLFAAFEMPGPGKALAIPIAGITRGVKKLGKEKYLQKIGHTLTRDDYYRRLGPGDTPVTMVKNLPEGVSGRYTDTIVLDKNIDFLAKRMATKNTREERLALGQKLIDNSPNLQYQDKYYDLIRSKGGAIAIPPKRSPTRLLWPLRDTMAHEKGHQMSHKKYGKENLSSSASPLLPGEEDRLSREFKQAFLPRFARLFRLEGKIAKQLDDKFVHGAVNASPAQRKALAHELAILYKKLNISRVKYPDPEKALDAAKMRLFNQDPQVIALGKEDPALMRVFKGWDNLHDGLVDAVKSHDPQKDVLLRNVLSRYLDEWYAESWAEYGRARKVHPTLQNFFDSLDISHKQIVEKAYKQGKNVPQHIRDFYGLK